MLCVHSTADHRVRSGLRSTELAGPAFAPTADLSLPWAERETVASVAVYEAEGLESARKIVEADPFYSGGVVSRGSAFEHLGRSMTEHVAGSGTLRKCS